jgi:hypothetical protein
MSNREEIEKTGAELFATAWNRLDSSIIASIIADDIEYTSRKTRKTVKGKTEVIEHLQIMMDKVKNAGADYKVFAELGVTEDEHPCVLLSQKYMDNIHTLVLFTVEWGKVARIDLCKDDPHPTSAKRTGKYPGYEDYDDDFEHYYDNDPDKKIDSIINIKPIVSTTTAKKKRKVKIVPILIIITLAGIAVVLMEFVLK